MPTAKGSAPKLPEPLLRIVEARHHDPFEVLGRHVSEGRAIVRAFLPQAESATLVEAQAALHRIEGTDLFVWVATGMPIVFWARMSARSKSFRASSSPFGHPMRIG